MKIKITATSDELERYIETIGFCTKEDIKGERWNKHVIINITRNELVDLLQTFPSRIVVSNPNSECILNFDNYDLLLEIYDSYRE